MPFVLPASTPTASPASRFFLECDKGLVNVGTTMTEAMERYRDIIVDAARGYDVCKHHHMVVEVVNCPSTNIGNAWRDNPRGAADIARIDSFRRSNYCPMHDYYDCHMAH